jgi:amylosucrase
MFLSDFYSGEFPGAFARGARFNYVPDTGDSRISGSFASLAGLEAALDAADQVRIDDAIARIRLGHALIMAWDGVPLLYMGDEIGLRNDLGYLDHPDRSADNRWLHRPAMDWAAAARRRSPGTVEARLFEDLRELINARRAAPQLHAAAPLEIVDLEEPGAFAFVRRHPEGDLLAIHNFGDAAVTVPAVALPTAPSGVRVDLLSGTRWAAQDDVAVGPREVRWIVAPEAQA